jgi:DNA-binding NtrC family response regulator
MHVVKNDPAATAPTVLVLEDDAELRFLLSDTLRDTGFRVVETSRADETLTHLRAPNDVRLVFADIKVPGSLDGHGLAHILQQEFPAIKIILTSEYMKEPIPPGVLFLRKPYILSRVIASVRSMLQLDKEA